MTRESAYTYFGRLPPDREVLDKFIDKIYDDLENQTCVNCKWDNSSENIRSCSLIGYTRYKDFGCNKWEAKDD